MAYQTTGIALRRKARSQSSAPRSGRPSQGIDSAAFIMTSAELGLSLKLRSISASLRAKSPNNASFAASSTCASASSGSISIALRT